MYTAHSTFYFERCASDSPIKGVEEHQKTSRRPFTRSQPLAFTSVSVPFRLREFSPASTLNPGRICRPKAAAKQPRCVEFASRDFSYSTFSSAFASDIWLYTSWFFKTSWSYGSSKRVRLHDASDMIDVSLCCPSCQYYLNDSSASSRLESAFQTSHDITRS